MLRPNLKTVNRKEAFRKVGEAIARREPTMFNFHYEIKGRAAQDRSLSLKIGPRMNTMQWEPTGKR